MADAPSPFETVRVVVSSHGAGRMLRQDVAAHGGVGICAGVEFLTPSAWLAALGRDHGLAEELTAWRSRRLDFAVWQELLELASEGSHPALGAFLSTPAPARPQAMARRVARLFRHYLAHAPELAEAWLAGDDVDGLGRELPTHLGWQPELFRRSAEALAVDPVETSQGLAEAVRNSPTTLRTGIFAVPELTRPEREVLAALAVTQPVPAWHVPAAHLTDWATPLASSTEALPAPAERPGTVEVHGSHGATRQAQVLRDELCRLLAADPSLEPRHVAIVTPDLARWWPILQSVFAPVADDAAHPGRTLRLQSAGVLAQPNLVLTLLADALALGGGRASATQVVELLTSRPVAHRWRLTDRTKVTELVSAAEVRWGLDATHRANQGLGDVTQNTWTRGLDRLLTGLALPPGETALPVTGVEGVASSDLELIGTLCEVVSRLRRFTARSSVDASPAEWVSRCREFLEEVAGLPWEDEWMLTDALRQLAELEAQLVASPLSLTRAQFGRIVDDMVREAPVRPAVGNGSMQVMATGDLLHVGFRVVCLVGITDAMPAPLADLVPLGSDVPDPRRVQLARLLAHARAAEHLLIVRQDRLDTTNLPTAAPTGITWLLRELGMHPEPISHPLTAHSPSNFLPDRPSFDRRAAAGARALLRRQPGTESAATLRRRAALHLPVPEAAGAATPADLVAFLRDPVKTFLRSAAGIRLFESASTTDAIPLTRGGLDVWGTRERLLAAAQQGTAVALAERAEVQRETLPPGEIGRAALAPDVALVSDLWGRAKESWQAEVVNHPVEVDAGGLTIRGTVRTRGGRVVALTVSDGPRTLLAPWVDLLLLAASGVRADGVVHRLGKHYGDVYAESRTLTQPEPEAAQQHLHWLALATRLGQNRLVPLPLTPAVAYLAMDGKEGSRRAWDLPTTSWESPWAWRNELWGLFYDGPANQLFSDPATPLDPPTLSGSGFEAWTRAVIAPIIDGSAS